jgi:hypothetical protein
MTQRLFHLRKPIQKIAMSSVAVAVVLGMAGCSVVRTPDGYTVGGAAAGAFIGDSMARTNRNGPTGNAATVP